MNIIYLRMPTISVISIFAVLILSSYSFASDNNTSDSLTIEIRDARREIKQIINQDLLLHNVNINK
jgi:hypothetical protein